MNIFKEKIDEIKKLIGLSSEEVKSEIKLSEAKLTDGTVINVDKLEVGGMVTIIGADGTSSPIPAGVYDLDNGNTIEVDENGMITKMDATVKAEEEVKETEIKQEAEVETEVKTELNSELVDRITSLENAVSELIKINTSTVEKLNEEIKMSAELSKKLELATDVKPIKKISSEISSDDRIKNMKKVLGL